MLPRVNQVPRVTSAQESGLTSIAGTMAYNTTLDLLRVMNNAGSLKSLPYADGTGASGTWGINISGNAATATTATTATGLNISGTGTRFGSITSTSTGGGEASLRLSRKDLDGLIAIKYLADGATEYEVGVDSGSSYYTIKNASNQFIFYLGQLGDLIIPSLTGAVVTTGSGGGIGSVTGTANQVLRISGTNTATFGAVDISSTDAVTGTLTVANGGTGQTSYTNGQLLIGNTTGNTLTKATLTGTASQITVTNGAGSITLSLPQNIATTSAPTFIGQTYTGYSAGSTTGIVNFSTATNGLAYITIGNLGRVIGTEATTGDFIINRNITYDGTTYRYLNTGAGAQVCLTTGTVILKTTASGTGGNTATFNNALVASNTGVSIATGDLTIDTAGKGLRIKQGSNAMFGTGAVLVAGTVTVSTTAVATGDTIFLSCTAAGGTQGIPRISAISNGTSFTITSSNAADTSTYSWLIIKAA
jgi:hypothetical protein